MAVPSLRFEITCFHDGRDLEPFQTSGTLGTVDYNACVRTLDSGIRWTFADIQGFNRFNRQVAAKNFMDLKHVSDFKLLEQKSLVDLVAAFACD